MNDEEILHETKTLLRSFHPKCKKFGGTVAVEIIRDALLEEGFHVSDRDVFIHGIPIEIDLLVAKKGVIPERRILFRQEDVLAVLEVKSRGTFGEQSLKKIENNFKEIKGVASSIQCLYVTVSDRQTYKWKATEQAISAPAFTLFWHSGPENDLAFKSTGDWQRLIERLRKIESSG